MSNRLVVFLLILVVVITSITAYIGTNYNTTIISQPDNLSHTRQVEQIIELTPTEEDSVPGIILEENYDNPFTLITTEEGREARRQILFSSVIEVIKTEVEEREGWYSFLTSEDKGVVSSQVVRIALGIFNTDLELIEEYARQYEERLEEMMPADIRGMSISELEILRSSLISLRSEYHTFSHSGTHSHIALMHRNVGLIWHSARSDGYLSEVTWSSVESEVRRDYLMDVFNDIPSVTEEERIEINGIETNEELLASVRRMIVERIDAAEPFDFIPYQERFLDKHGLNIPIERNRRNVNDMISWMLWIYRSPLREKALEGIDENSLEWDSIDAKFSVYQPENGWRSRERSIREVEGDFINEFTESFESYVERRDVLLERIRLYENMIRYASHSHKSFIESIAKPLEKMYRDIRGNNYDEIEYAFSLRIKMGNYIREVEEEKRRLSQ